MRTSRAVTVLAATAAIMLIGPTASAEPDGAGSSDWGQVASDLAQLPTEHSTTDDGDDANGGAMGQHSRSTEGANQQGGFAAQDTDGDGDGGNAFNITLSDNTDGDTGRAGVGNATRSAPHNEECTCDGGNGQHALNNADAAETLDPVTGDLTESAGGTAPDFSDELREGTSADESDD